MCSGINVNALWRTTALLAERKGVRFNDRWYKGLAGSRTFLERHRMAPVRTIHYYKILKTSKSTAPPSFFQPLIGLLPILIPQSPPSGYSLREHQHWGILPVPSRAADQHVVLEQPCLSFQPLPVLSDLYVDIRPIFDPRDLFSLKKDT